jgi:hypothetical protein
MKLVNEQVSWEWISWHLGYNVPDRFGRTRESRETPGLEQRDEEIAAGLKTCASIMPSFVIAGSPRAVGMASVEQ